MNIKREPSRELAPRSRFYFPFLDDLQERMNQLMLFGNERQTDVSLSEDDAHIYVEVNLPGLKSNEIDISIHQNTLWIKGERREEREDKERTTHSVARRSFFYHIDLPAQVEEHSEQAQFEDGVLKVIFKKAHSNQVRKINLAGEKKNPPKNSK